MKVYTSDEAMLAAHGGHNGDLWVRAHIAQQLYDAMEAIDKDLEGRNFLEDSSLRDTARAAMFNADFADD